MQVFISHSKAAEYRGEGGEGKHAARYLTAAASVLVIPFSHLSAQFSLGCVITVHVIVHNEAQIIQQNISNKLQREKINIFNSEMSCNLVGINVF